MYAFLDVDGTIIDKDGQVRPYLFELVSGITAAGGDVVLWSAGGRHYAELQLRRLPPEVQQHILAVFGKGDPLLRGVLGPRFYIDDMPELVWAQIRAGHGGFAVHYYEPVMMLDDTELLAALTAFQQYASDVRVPSYEGLQ